jgi:hypothetical protein
VNFSTSLKVTLGDDLLGTLVFDPAWFTNLESMLDPASISLGVCWPKATAVRDELLSICIVLAHGAASFGV